MYGCLQITKLLPESIEPEEVYLEYQKAISLSSKFGEIDRFLSSKSLANRKKYIEQQKTNGKDEAEIHKQLYKRAMHKASCIKNLQKIDKTKSANTAVVTFSFEDPCSLEMKKSQPEIYKDMIIANVLEVRFVYEEGWKIDRSSPRPNKPKKMKQVIKLNP